jgi:hypothetical protein
VLTKKAWGAVRSQTGLAKLPLTGGVLAVVAFVLVGIPGALLADSDDEVAAVGGIVTLAVAAYLATFVVVYFNVVLAIAADQAMRGENPDVAAARAAARSHLRSIAAWALVSAVFSVLVRAVRHRGGVSGFMAAVGADMWTLVTFLVVPILAFERIGPIAAMKRSAAMFHQRWGQQLTGGIVIGGATGLFVLFGVLIAIGGAVLLVAGATTTEVVAGFVIVVVGAVVGIGGAVFGGATRGVFGVALYRYIDESRALEPFTTIDLETAVSPTPRPGAEPAVS